MATTTLGVKLDDATRERLKLAAQQLDRTPHWLIKQAIFTYLEQVEGGLGAGGDELLLRVPFEHTRVGVALDGDLLHLPGVDLLDELGDGGLLHLFSRVGEELVEGHEQDDEDHPEADGLVA